MVIANDRQSVFLQGGAYADEVVFPLWEAGYVTCEYPQPIMHCISCQHQWIHHRLIKIISLMLLSMDLHRNLIISI